MRFQQTGQRGPENGVVKRLRLLGAGCLFVGGCAIGMLGGLPAIQHAQSFGMLQTGNRPDDEAPVEWSGGPCRSLGRLLELDTAHLAEQDIARVNLLCATDLPGAEKLDVESCLRTLDDWAGRIRSETERSMYMFTKNPADYQHSEGYFRVLMMITILQQDMGIHYNPERAKNPDFRNSADLFIHGMLGYGDGGTCVSMPVLYVAVGRRLGYSLHLAQTKSHVYARWDDLAVADDEFNIEATNQGLNTHPDEHYKHWPVELTEKDLARGVYLRNLTPSESLGAFLQARGHCLEDTGRLREALIAYSHANAIAPQMPYALAYLVWAIQKEVPELTLSSSPQRRRGLQPGIPAAIDPIWVDALNEHNRRMLAGEMPPGTPGPAWGSPGQYE